MASHLQSTVQFIVFAAALRRSFGYDNRFSKYQFFSSNTTGAAVGRWVSGPGVVNCPEPLDRASAFYFGVLQVWVVLV